MIKYILLPIIFLVFTAISYAIVQPKSCLKPDGDWVDGLTKRECKSIGGKWMMQK